MSSMAFVPDFKGREARDLKQTLSQQECPLLLKTAAPAYFGLCKWGFVVERTKTSNMANMQVQSSTLCSSELQSVLAIHSCTYADLLRFLNLGPLLATSSVLASSSISHASTYPKSRFWREVTNCNPTKKSHVTSMLFEPLGADPEQSPP